MPGGGLRGDTRQRRGEAGVLVHADDSPALEPRTRSATSEIYHGAANEQVAATKTGALNWTERRVSIQAAP